MVPRFSRSEAVLFLLFNSARPQFVDHPHIVLKTGDSLYDAMRKAFSCDIAYWPVDPPSASDLTASELFSHWHDSECQQDVEHWLCGGGFVVSNGGVFVSADCSVSWLESHLPPAQFESGTPDIDLSDVLTGVGWIGIPVRGDFQMLLIVALSDINIASLRDQYERTRRRSGCVEARDNELFLKGILAQFDIDSITSMLSTRLGHTAWQLRD
ncbi:MAG: hypothetical protein WD065_02045 [Planctomycetaceae bacterium]